VFLFLVIFQLIATAPRVSNVASYSGVTTLILRWGTLSGVGAGDAAACCGAGAAVAVGCACAVACGELGALDCGDPCAACWFALTFGCGGFTGGDK